MAQLPLILRRMQKSVPSASHPPGLGYNDIGTTWTERIIKTLSATEDKAIEYI